MSNASQSNNTASPVLIAILAVGYLELPCSLIGCTLNAGVIFLCLKLVRRPNNTNQWIVLSMTVADLLFCCTFCPMILLKFSFAFYYPKLVCYVTYICIYLAAIASSLSLLILNIDKFIYLHKPLHYFLIVTQRRIVIYLGVCWAMALAWACFLILGPYVDYQIDCNFRPNVPLLYTAFLGLFITLPLICSLFLSIAISVIVKRVLSARKGSLADTFTVLNNAPGAGGQRKSLVSLGTINRQRRRSSAVQTSLRQHCRPRSSNQSHLKSIAFVFTTTIWASCTVLPYRIGYALNISGIVPPTESTVLAIFCLILLMSINAAGNPLVTTLTQRQYTRLIKRLFHEKILRKPYRDENRTLTEVVSRASSRYRRYSSAQICSPDITFKAVEGRVPVLLGGHHRLKVPSVLGNSPSGSEFSVTEAY